MACCALCLRQWLTFFTVVSPALSICDTPVIFNGNYSTGSYEYDSLTLKCNASSADTITWFYRPPGKDAPWEPYEFSWCPKRTCNWNMGGRSLNIGEVSMEMDDAQFICVASCSTTLKNATAFINLGVQKCFTRKPELMPGQNVSASRTQNVTLTCEAKMGRCYELTEHNFLWVNGSNKRLVNSEKYNVNIILKEDGSLVTSLTIYNVGVEDFNTSYTCILIDDHFEQGNNKTTIHLLQTELKTGAVKPIGVGKIVGLVSFVIVVIAVLVFLWCFCRYCRYRIKYRQERNKIQPGEYRYDALVWKDDEHREEAKQLIDKLKTWCYRIVTEEEGQSGYAMHSLETLIQQSACVIFLRKEDGDTLTVLTEAQNKRNVFVINTQKNREGMSKAMAGFVRLRWPQHDTKKMICPCLAKHRQNEFYYRLRLGLPKPDSNCKDFDDIPLTTSLPDLNP